MASSTRKRVLMSTSISRHNDKLTGYRDEYIAEVEKYFDILWWKDFERNPELGQTVEAALVGPGARLMGLVMKLEKFPKLKVVANFGVGVDHMKNTIKVFNSHGIKVSNTPNVLNNAVADQAIGLILAAARNTIEGHKKVTDPRCTQWEMDTELGVDVSEATLGIVGMGRIGQKIAHRAAGFDMRILYHNRNRRSEDEEAITGAIYFQSLHEMLKECDFVVISCPHTDETDGLFSDAEFDIMKRSAILVNVARGKIINQEALVRALRGGKIMKAALDVTFPEPLPRDHPLLELPNVIFTPHVASATLQTRMKMLRCVLDNIKAGLEDRPLPNEVHFN